MKVIYCPGYSEQLREKSRINEIAEHNPFVQSSRSSEASEGESVQQRRFFDVELFPVVTF
jgi:hypothetical protein